MDALTTCFASSRDTRIDTFRICRLMRKAESSYEQCLAASLKLNPQLVDIRFFRQRAQRKSKLAGLLIEEIILDESAAVEQMGHIINRFGSSNIPRMMIAQYKNLMQSINRAHSFFQKSVESAHKAQEIEKRYLALAVQIRNGD